MKSKHAAAKSLIKEKEKRNKTLEAEVSRLGRENASLTTLVQTLQLKADKLKALGIKLTDVPFLKSCTE